MYAINLEAAQAGSVVSSAEPFIHSALTIVGMLWVSFRIDPLMALLALCVMPFLYYSVGYYIRHIQQPLYDTKMMEGDSMSIVHDAMAMVPITAAFGREDHEVRRYMRKGAETADSRIRITVRQSLFSLAVNMITAIGTALVLGFGAQHVLQHKLSVGQLLVIIAYIAAVYKPLESISYTLGAMQDSLVGVRMAFEVRDVEPLIKDAPNARPIGRSRGHVTFEAVNFNYPTRPGVLNDISFDAQPGQVIAVVGPTGAGKTTLVSLLLRFYDPSHGRILLDGRDIKGITLRSLREQIAFVPQEPLLFWGTVAENIR
jgi:ABC-type multidrug transport system fused ATPase/permease subunit